MRIFFIIVVLVGVALSGVPGQAETTFDLSKDFSTEKNPNNVWQYGYTTTNALDVDQFRLDKNTDTSRVVGFWHPDENKGPGPGYYPYIAHNNSKQTQLVFNGLAFRPDEVAMESSTAGQYGMIRFVAPVTGTYKVSVQFEGIHFGLSTTDVHVLHNSTSLFDAEIDGYGGDPAFHKVQGASPTAEYSGQVAMKKDETLTLAIGVGKNKTNSCDTTGLFARVILLGDSHEPGK